MPRKKKKTLREDSLTQMQPATESVLTFLKTETEELVSFETEADEEVEIEELKMPLSRTSLLIQDYLEFKAARCVQRFVRGWLHRTKYKRQRLAAIKIQAEWRRFYCQRMHFRKVEDDLQRYIEQHFYRAAQIIQAVWRGWWVRHHIHDFSRLQRLQLMAGEDLLYCVAFKLHHLLRTHQIPGVYSLRNSNVLSKVEQLLNFLRFTKYNQRSIRVMHQLRYEKSEATKQHKKSAFGTRIPFPGPDVSSRCVQKCTPLYNTKDADIRMAKILQMYEEANMEMSKPQVLRKKSTLYKQPPDTVPISKSSSFCGDVVKSMKKWKILTENNLSVDLNVFKKPQNLDNFLKEIESKMSVLQESDYNNNEISEHLNKEKASYIPSKGREKEDFKCLSSIYDEVKLPISTCKGASMLPGINFNGRTAICNHIFTSGEAKSCNKEANDGKNTKRKSAKRESHMVFSRKK